jgi:hypothetical protein
MYRSIYGGTLYRAAGGFDLFLVYAIAPHFLGTIWLFMKGQGFLRPFKRGPEMMKKMELEKDGKAAAPLNYGPMGLG